MNFKNIIVVKKTSDVIDELKNDQTVDVVHGIIADVFSAELLTIEIPILLFYQNLQIANAPSAAMIVKA